MKYKIGDKVRIKNDLEKGMYYGECYFTAKMKQLSGMTVTIASRNADGDCVFYEIVEDGGNYIWTEEMFEKRIVSNNGLAQQVMCDHFCKYPDLVKNEIIDEIILDTICDICPTKELTKQLEK